ncbi:hypothetical protein SISNIDRAFT_486658 [Sistotremastrum niveocremeum HHB9708]|uniref:Uncharacterized protein n=1 Tax=Sistotremastrum niveocremeum HHB9708 TaxID=1314777 RepID=A0A164T6T3_9AGAM|nr:hypothetical protein SISNIDRAFT_486658 [Sistotremastrum niveocremeum HHB9708]
MASNAWVNGARSRHSMLHIQPQDGNDTCSEWPPNPYPVAISGPPMRSPLYEGAEFFFNPPGSRACVPQINPSSATTPLAGDDAPFSNAENLLQLESHQSQQRPLSDSPAVKSPTTQSYGKPTDPRVSASEQPQRSPIECQTLDERLAMQGLRDVFGPSEHLPEDEDEFLSFVAQRVLELAGRQTAMAKL